MAQSYNLMIEYSGDWRLLRDFLFDACHCTGFVGPSMKAQVGRPAPHEEIYNVHNDYLLVGLREKFEGGAYKNDVQVSFTLNDGERWAQWERDALSASIRWLAQNDGDGLLDWDGLPILARRGSDSIVINDFSKNNRTRRVEAAQRPEYQKFVRDSLQAEQLVYTIGSLDPI
jgi:hypothetical protein